MMPEILESIKPEMRVRLEEAKAAGIPVVLVSAALHEAVAEMGEMLGARGEGTKVEVRDGRLTGKGQAPANGPRKAERVQQVADELGVAVADSIGYGDTEPDTTFLALMGRAVAVDPDAGLRREAVKHGWEILETTS
jgi:HAD superfamily phosphoserine phosphatase-like hydrolase